MCDLEEGSMSEGVWLSEVAAPLGSSLGTCF